MNALQGKKVYLRAYKEDDLIESVNNVNHYPSRVRGDNDPPFPVSLEEGRKYIEKAIKAEDKPNFTFAICRTGDDKLIGDCGLFNFNATNRNCKIGIGLGADYQGQGYGYEALSLLNNFIFNELNLNKIKLNVFSFNTPAIKCYQKLGFVEEGRLKNELYRSGQWHDVILMALFSKG
ncbi:MAG: GNAT family N-acetyltransferase [Spirochaetaceae bacterium]|nr:GNAT family N-acetyltransferase [Spirochaetaceae bacterium]